MQRRILILFFASGALGLGYQVLWSKLVLHFVGVSSWSHAVVLAAFMTGLALGSRLFGRLADLVASPLLMFGLLEASIGACALLYEPLAGIASKAYLGLVAHAPEGAGGTHGLAVKALVAGLLLLPPTTLMGGTYPALVRHATRSVRAAGRSAASLYAVNACGAVAGTLAMAFVLMPALGIHRSLLLFACANLAVGLVAAILSRGESRAERPAEHEETESDGVHAGSARLALVLAFVAGFLSFTLEIAWTRLFGISLGSSTQSFAVILAAFIGGIAGGSALIARHERRIRRPLAFLGWTELGAAALVLLPMPVVCYVPWALGRLARDLPSTARGHDLHELMKLTSCLLIMLPPALLLGASIPLVVKATARSLPAIGRDAGTAYAWNTAGNVLGALASGLVLLPLLGVERLIVAAAGALAATGAIAIVLGSPPAERAAVARRAAIPVTLVLVLGAALPRWDPAWFTLASFRRANVGDFAATRATVESRRVVFAMDDPAANVMVTASRVPGDTSLTLLVNGKPDASSSGDASTQVLLAHLPLLLHAAPKSVLVIGLASGITSGAALEHPIERLDVVDVVAGMPRAAALFDEWNRRPLQDPRTTFIADDARSFLRASTAKWDVVISEPSNPWTAGTGSLFSSEMYAETARHLQPGGFHVQWLQAYELGDPLFAAVIRSFRSAYPHVSLWDTATGDTLLIGSFEPLAPDAASIERRMQDAAISARLRPLRLHGARDLLFLQRFGSVTIDWIAATGTLQNTDDNLLLECRAPRDLFLRATPAVLDALDERLVGAPSLPWSRAVRAAAGGGPWDPEPLARLMSGRLFGGTRLMESLLTGWSRAHGMTLAETVERIGGRLRLDGRAMPPTQDELLHLLRTAVAAGDDDALASVMARERTAILDAALIEPPAASAWSSELVSLLAGASPRASLQLRLLHCDVLASTGDAVGALRLIDDCLGVSPSPTPEESVLRACRIDEGAPCDAVAGRVLAAGHDERVRRFVDLRRSRLASAPTRN